MAARTPDVGQELEPVQEYTMRHYMADKVRKLQAQGEAITGTNVRVAAEPNKPGVFLGVRVFVTGYTEPSQQELRALVFTHGGLFVHYLTPAEEITYIVATQLTPKKVQEWGGRALYRVVTPAWVVDSASAGCRLPWATYQPECMRGRGQASLLRQLTGTATSNPSSVTQPAGMATELMIRTAALPPQMAANSAIPKPTPPIPSGCPEPPRSGAKDPSRTTATDPAFLKNYYQASRLHLLSAFKSELQAYIIEQVTAAGAATGPSRPPPGPGEHRVIFYADFDCFFAAVALRSRPDLVDRPVAVSHCQDPTTQSSHSDLASCNYVARNFGIKNGMHVGRARQLCPQLVLLPYDFEAYKAISRAFYQILTEYSPHVQVGSMDEAILDVTHHFPADAHLGSSDGTAYLGLAKRLRGQVHAATGCQISVGIATSIVLAKLAARRAKPHGQFYIAPEAATAVIAPLPVRDLPGVGWSNANKLATQSITTIGQLQQADPSGLADLLGPKVAQQLQRLACGKDDRLVQTHTERRSIGTEVGWGVRFERTDQVVRFLADLCHEVAQRMAAAAVQGRSVVLKVKRRQSGAGEPHKHLGHGLCDTFTRTASLPLATREATVLQTACERLLRQLAVPPTELRALGIQVQKLVSDTPGLARLVGEPTLRTFFSGPQRSPKGKGLASETTIGDSPRAKIPPAQADHRQQTTGESGPSKTTELNSSATNTPPASLPTTTPPGLSVPSPRISREVWRCLPASLRRDIAQRYRIDPSEARSNLFHDQVSPSPSPLRLLRTSENSATSGQSYGTTENSLLPDKNPNSFPSPSQIDESVLRDLPAALQREIRITMYHRAGFRRFAGVSGRPDSGGGVLAITDVPRTATKEQSTRARGRKRGRPAAAVQQPRSPVQPPSRDRMLLGSTESGYEDYELLTPYRGHLSWDEVAHFPQEIRAEVLRTHFRRRKRQAKHSSSDNGPVPGSNTGTDSATNDTASPDSIPQIEYPSLAGAKSLTEQRALLSEWIETYREGPTDEDVQELVTYLVQLVHFCDLERARLLLCYLISKQNAAWAAAIRLCTNVVNKTTHKLHGAILLPTASSSLDHL